MKNKEERRLGTRTTEVFGRTGGHGIIIIIVTQLDNILFPNSFYFLFLNFKTYCSEP